MTSGDRDSPPVFVRVRDPQRVWSTHMVDEWIDALPQKSMSGMRVRVHGKTTAGWPLRSISVGNPNRMIALIGGIHASEGGPEILIPILERLMSEEAELLETVGLAILPLVNGDGRNQFVEGYPWYVRKNPAGVDLNRNFDANWAQVDTLYDVSTMDPDSPTYRGPHPASEPETKAVVDFVRTTTPLAVVSLHGPGTLFILPRDADPEYTRSAIDLAIAFHRGCAGGEFVGKFDIAKRSGPGTLALWVYETARVPAFDIECSRSDTCLALMENRISDEQMQKLRETQYGGVRGARRLLAE